MTLQELQKQALQLPIGDRWRLVQSLLTSIEQETRSFTSSSMPSGEPGKPIDDLNPWTQSLIGVITLDF